LTRQQLLSLLAATIIVVAFFLPWMEGSGRLDARVFSGFDFARLVRNFEITAGSASAEGQIRATAVAIYLVPALAVNGALLHVAAAFSQQLRTMSGLALLSAAAYGLLVLLTLLALSVLPLNEFEDVVGLPAHGLGLTVAGALTLAWCGLRELRPRDS